MFQAVEGSGGREEGRHGGEAWLYKANLIQQIVFHLSHLTTLAQPVQTRLKEWLIVAPLIPIESRTSGSTLLYFYSLFLAL